MIRSAPAAEAKRLLDVGCGTGRLLDAIKTSNRKDIDYRGVDLSPALLEAAKKKHPEVEFICGDPFDLDEIWSPAPDYVVFGGIFTCRLQMSQEQMTDYMVRMLRLAFAHCCRGIVFNVMSAHVDWQRADYGLYEYAVYVYK